MSQGRIGNCCGGCGGVGFDAPAYRIHIWRSDGWDWGSNLPPQFVFIVGAFTKWQNSDAGRIAKFRKSNAARPLFDTGFAAKNYFSGPMEFVASSRGSAVKLLAGNVGRERQGEVSHNLHDVGVPKVAWLIDAVSGDVSFTVPDPLNFFTFVGFMSCINGKVGVTDFVKFHSFDINGAATITREGNINTDFIHDCAGMVDSWFVSSRPRDFGSWTTPYGLRLINGNLTQKPQFLGSGSDVAIFNTIGFPNQQTGTSRHCYLSATKEFVRGDGKWTWAGAEYVNPVTNPELANVNGVMFAVQEFGGLLAQFKVVPVETSGLRAQPFSVDHLGRLWFSGAVTKVWTRDGLGTYTATVTQPDQLYVFDHGASPKVRAFEGFVGGVPLDCRYFGDGPTQGRQYIVVGSFTGYRNPGVPGVTYRADRILYINEDGVRLPNLEWP